MNRFRKAISVGVTATLLASLMATVAAPAAFAALTSTTGGTIVPGGSSSAAFTLTAAEDTVTDFSNGSFTVAVYDSVGDDTATDVNWDTSSVPSVTVNAGVGGATAGFVDDTLVVTVTGTDVTKIDSFTIGNLRVLAGVDADAGAVIFDVIADTLDAGPATGLPEGLVPASGTTETLITGGDSDSFDYLLDDGSPDFQVTGTACDSAAAIEASTVTVAAAGVVPLETFSADTVAGAAPPGDLTGTVTKATPLTGNKAIGTAVTQSVCASRFPSAVTVGDAVNVFNQWEFNPSLQAGVNNEDPADIEADLGFFDELLLANDIVTFTLATTGVLFSPDSELTDDIFGCDFSIPNSSIVLSADRKSITVKIPEDTEGGIDCIDFGPHVDIALGVASGTAININVSVSRSGVTVLGNPVTVAFVGFVVAGSTAAPTVLIGQNDQSTGMITLRESAAGSIGGTFTGATTPPPRGFIKVCLASGWGESWSVGRYFWAVVTSGDLKLNVDGLAATQGKMFIDATDTNCLEIQVYTPSTVASTIEIRDGSSSAPAATGATNGPKINVPTGAEPGAVYVDVYADAPDAGFTLSTQVGDNIVIAVRAYSGTPIVTVSGQPNVVRGGLSQPIGNIIITEGAPNQFADLEEFQICLVTQTGLYNPGAFDWSSPIGINQPVISTNSTVSGLIAFFDATEPDVGGCFNIDINDTSLGGLGVITISNLKLDVMADAPLGSVFVRVFDGHHLEFCSDNNTTCFPSADLVNQVVSPASVGNPVAGAAATRLGVTQIGAFTTSTKVAATGKYVTYRFDFGVAAAGKTFQVWGATKTGNDWSAFTVVTSRVANASGVVYYYIRSNSATWKSYRAYWSGGAVWTPARQARWIS